MIYLCLCLVVTQEGEHSAGGGERCESERHKRSIGMPFGSSSTWMGNNFAGGHTGRLPPSAVVDPAARLASSKVEGEAMIVKLSHDG